MSFELTSLKCSVIIWIHRHIKVFYIISGHDVLLEAWQKVGGDMSRPESEAERTNGPASQLLINSWSRRLCMSECWTATSQLSSSSPTFQEHLWCFAHDCFLLQSRHASCVMLDLVWSQQQTSIPTLLLIKDQNILVFEPSCSHLGESRPRFDWQLAVS